MPHARLIFCAALALMLSCAEISGAQSPKLMPLHIAVSTNTVTWFPLYVGWKKGIFKEQGFEILPIRMSVRTALAALGSKQIHYITPIGSSMTAIAQGFPGKVVMIFAKRSHLVLITRREVRTAEQLRGKSIAISLPGGTVHRQLLKIFEKYDIKPGDVNVINLGETPNRALALSRGLVDGAMLNIPFDLMLEKDGLRPFAYLKDIADIPLLGVVTHNDRLKERPDEVRKLLAACLKSIAYTKTHRDEVAPLLMHFVGLENQQMSVKAFDLIKDLWADDGMATEDGLKSALALADVAPTVPIDKIFSFAAVQEAARLKDK
jgi:ABC-type nitrate/sulfonate/bicarbonate transport system substrate-binding protein